MRKRTRRILVWGLVAGVVLVIGLRMYYVIYLRPPRIIKIWGEPVDSHIEPGKRLALAVVSDGIEWRWPFPRRKYAFVYGRRDSLLEKGERRPFRYPSHRWKLEDYLDECGMDWVPQYHIRLLGPEGERIYINYWDWAD